MNAQLTPLAVWGHVLHAFEGDPQGVISGSYGPSRHWWDISGRCGEPRGATMIGRPFKSFWRRRYHSFTGRVENTIKVEDSFRHSVELSMSVPCRRCGPCRRFRAWLWSSRAMSEAKASTRVWMGTLTVRPEERFKLQYSAEEYAARRQVAWETLDEGEKFIRLQVELGKVVTLWLKRLRKAGHRFRYLLTFEAHKSGFPHVHVVIHELSTEIRKRVLDASWRIGFAKFKLLPRGDEARAVRYVTKYIAKNGAARVRASIRYGVAGSHTTADGVGAPAAVQLIKLDPVQILGFKNPDPSLPSFLPSPAKGKVGEVCAKAEAAISAGSDRVRTYVMGLDDPGG